MEGGTERAMKTRTEGLENSGGKERSHKESRKVSNYNKTDWGALTLTKRQEGDGETRREGGDVERRGGEEIEEEEEKGQLKAEGLGGDGLGGGRIHVC